MKDDLYVSHCVSFRMLINQLVETVKFITFGAGDLPVIQCEVHGFPRRFYAIGPSRMTQRGNERHIDIDERPAFLVLDDLLRRSRRRKEQL